MIRDIMDQQFSKLFEKFFAVQSEKYLEVKNKEVFDSPEEKEMVKKVVQDGWDTYIETKKNDLLSMSEHSIVNFFEAIDLTFPAYGESDKTDFLSDEMVDDDETEDFDALFNTEDSDELDDDDMEELHEELNRLADELESIPEDERQDVVMLMLAFPALQEIGFPINIFMGGDGNVQLNETQRKQIDWARQLAYKIVDMADEHDINAKSEKYDHVKEFAAAFIPEGNIEHVIDEIRIAYERGGEFG